MDIFHLSRLFYKVFVYVVLAISFVTFLYMKKSEQHFILTPIDSLNDSVDKQLEANITNASDNPKVISESLDEYFNIWCIFTKVKRSNSYFKNKFSIMVKSVLFYSSLKLSFNIVSDSKSKIVAQSVFKDISNCITNVKKFQVLYHDVHNITTQLSKITAGISPLFASGRTHYYNEPLFFISLGLHKVAPSSQSKVILLDIDLKFVADIAELFQEFDRFEEKALIGVGPELSPTYRIALSKYRSLHKDTPFGRPLAVGGFQGVNSGVTLLHLDRIRASREFQQLLTPAAVKELTDQYSLQVRLGDQDLFTLIGMSRPHLLHQLSCGWNYQLCYPYTHPNYSLDTFDDLYAYCGQPIKVYHGNCKAPIPSD